MGEEREREVRSGEEGGNYLNKRMGKGLRMRHSPWEKILLLIIPSSVVGNKTSALHIIPYPSRYLREKGKGRLEEEAAYPADESYIMRINNERKQGVGGSNKLSHYTMV